MKPITKEHLAEKMEELPDYNFIDVVMSDYGTEEELANAFDKCVAENERGRQ